MFYLKIIVGIFEQTTCFHSIPGDQIGTPLINNNDSNYDVIIWRVQNDIHITKGLSKS